MIITDFTWFDDIYDGFSDDSNRFSRILRYASVTNMTFKCDGGVSINLARIPEERVQLDVNNVLKFDKPCQEVTFVNCRIIFTNILFELPENVFFTNTNIYLYNAYIAKLPSIENFINTLIFIDNNRWRSNTNLANDIIDMTNKFSRFGFYSDPEISSNNFY